MKLIIEMEMPKCCWDCACCDSEYGYCAARKKPLDDPNERPDWCPIVCVLPDEHGDLIDRDALLETCIYYYINPNKGAVDADNIIDMPVIIEAERKDDGD